MIDRIVIPSYKRSKVINEKTLAYLDKCNVPLNIVDIFVSDKEQLKENEK